MHLVAPDVLDAARNLSAGGAFALLGFGLLIWSAGWRFHRFLVVFAITLAAGALGLQAGRETPGQQVLVVGVLVAIAAGVLALELAKLIAFATGGVAAWVGVQAVMPQALELWAVFLSGGLLGVALYRFWTMLTTSFLGALVALHAGLILAGPAWGIDAGPWASARGGILNGVVVAVTVLGVLIQSRTAAADEVLTELPEAEPLPAVIELKPAAAVRRSWIWLRGSAA